MSTAFGDNIMERKKSQMRQPIKKLTRYNAFSPDKKIIITE